MKHKVRRYDSLYIVWYDTKIHAMQNKTMQYSPNNTIPYNTVQTIQNSTTHYNTIQDNTKQYYTVLYNAIECNTILYSTYQQVHINTSMESANIYICTYTTYIEYSISLPKRNVGYTKISKNSLHENLDHGNRSGQTPCWDPQVAWKSGKKQRRWAAGHLAMAAGRSLEFPSELRIWCLERMMRDSSSWCHYFRDLWTKDV